ncbi:rhomboid family intramembrane serine protease [Sphingobacteriaceae bacterium]|nr:rhomboid family intramembrane serine protease [Sphingobacteriaceae bacterium]
MQNTLQYNFTNLGVLPRNKMGLPGIVTSVFIHGNLSHIVSNTLPLLVLGMMLFYFYKKIAKPVFLWIWLISGIWLWLGGRNTINYPTYHIGASTLVYGLAGFLFFSGVFRRHLRLMVVSALVVFLYGGIVWGIFPIKEEISWEGHLFGMIAGILVAFNYRKEGPQKRVHQWNEEEDDATDLPWQEVQAPPLIAPESKDEITITYIYKEKDKET